MRQHDRNTFNGGVSQAITMECVDSDGLALTLEAELGYHPADPYAVTTTFRTPGGDVVWTFARELLSRGLTDPAGDGDVHVWPCLNNSGRAVVIIELNSPDGELLVQVKTQDILKFLSKTTLVVPEGSESDYLDVDLLIGRLLQEAA